MMFQNEVARQGGGDAVAASHTPFAACLRSAHQTMQFLNDRAR
jgi:hypothetical protein